MRPAPCRPRGFTLIEVLVALAVVAVALAAGMRALAQSADAAATLKLRTLALWVAQNRLAQAQLQSPWPAPGTTAGGEVQASVTLAWRETVSATPNPAFRRIEIVVTQPDVPEYALARLAGYLGNASR
ncbi:MAG: type II secretion system minor pseudopilin GspI [Betaproteobacteria bacterium]|nr:type II secretion system minor pseudopilin GspI [Betaproteobacteria bacterium]MDE2003946.1 type II secretion system minor pseudopilin GspI [Betaproteobacteria bacterium]MDE2208112.1 type II secretion system minor pseudopilin GspI [Betaproteobacteria bacterium]MDE2359381.1 type II secretion system minor pseudopilin GspI [Betaproteobacteria bacterium]